MATTTTTTTARTAASSEDGEHVIPDPGWRGSRTMVMVVLIIAFVTDAIFWGIVLPVLPFSLIDRVHVKPEDVQKIVSQALSIFSAAGVIACPILGIVSDRFGSRKLPFMLGLICLLVATILLATATTVAQIMVARLLQGLSAASVWVAGLAMLQDAVGGDRLGSALGTCFAWVTFGELIAPPAGGIIYRKFGYWAVWQVCSVLIVIDLIARLLLREPKTPRYGPSKHTHTSPDSYGSVAAPPANGESTHRIAPSNGAVPQETQPLLLPSAQDECDGDDEGDDESRSKETWFERVWPIAKLHRTSRFNAALLNGFAQALVISAIESTMPLHVHRIFGFDSLQAGLLFLPLVLPGVVLGPILGNLADTKGARYVTMRGFMFLAPGLAFFRLPGSKWFDDLFPSSWTQVPVYSTFPYLSPSVALFCFLLFFVGFGYPAISSPSLLESSQAVEDYQIEHGNDVFGPRGPWASVYAMNNVVFFAGLTVGPLCGYLVDIIGFGNMTIILAIFCLGMAVSCATFLPSVRPTPKPRQRRRRQGQITSPVH
ncbi:hypothetical protein A4X09_0g2562 [Tilletia walkeri]|uniref:Major facilitator superfamily (MFS) profile domain-containing protein n=1 Tax=Tilletia walkeri TaxID=117179 RepID=A0A8X7T5J7_9BASI|nr:hypothetical protein A4X09_0g2562 [Tilletia walkeri]